MNITKTQTIITDVSKGKKNQEYTVQRNAAFTLVLVASGNVDADAKIIVKLSEPGASAQILGVMFGSGSAKFLLHTLQLHKAPGTTSNLLIKTVLTEHATSTYDGAIRVEPNAQKTDAYQRNENLLASPDTKAVSSPALEILANDVRCTHGATAGPIDEEELWYLSSRGIRKHQGRELIMRGFLNDALLKIGDIKVRHDLQKQFGIGV